MCAYTDCPKPVKCAGLCSGHYEQRRRGQDLKPLRGRQRAECKSWGCTECPHAQGYCQRHYDRMRQLRGTRNGTLEQRRARSLRFNYGITVDDYNEMLEQQNGVCAICERECSSGRQLAVDHDHETGEVRGLLCAPCNTALGLFNDNLAALDSAVAYLTAWKKTGRKKK